MLAAATWKIDLAAARYKLQGLGFEAQTEERWYDYYARFDKLFADARTFVPGSKLNSLCDNLNIRCSAQPADWESGVGRLLLGARSITIEECFDPKATECRKSEALAGYNRNNTRMFTGRKWSEVLFTPFYDVPFRPCMLWAIGRVGDFARDVAIKDLRSCGEAGIAVHPDALAGTAPICAINDIALFLRLQASHYSTRKTPLALACWHVDKKRRTRRSWSMFNNRQVVLWSDSFSADLLEQAVYSNARLSISALETRGREAVCQFWLRHSAHDGVAAAIRNAKPWTRMFEDYIEASSDSQVEDLFQQMLVRNVSLSQLLFCLKPENALRVHELLEHEKPKTMFVGGIGITLGPEGLYTASRGTLISEIQAQIDTIYNYPEIKNQGIAGTIKYRDDVLPFKSLRDEMTYDPFTWCQKYYLQKRGVLAGVCSHFKGLFFDVVFAQHKPVVVAGVSAVGWDDARRSFELPKFSIDSCGNVSPQLNGLDLFDNAPAQNIEAPRGDPTPEELASYLTNRSANSAFWALWTTLVANILAPAFGKQTYGIVLYGGAAEHNGLVLQEDLGLHNAEMRQSELQEYELRHRWPTTARFRISYRSINAVRYANRPHKIRNCVLHARPDVLSGFALSGDYHCVYASRSNIDVDRRTCAGSLLFPEYLRDLCSRELQLADSGTGVFVYDVLLDVKNWLKSLRVSSLVLNRAKKFIMPASPTLYAGVVAELVKKAKLPRVKGGLFVSSELVGDLLEARHCPCVNAERITPRLVAAGCLVKEAWLGDRPGWVIDKKWLNENQGNVFLA